MSSIEVLFKYYYVLFFWPLGDNYVLNVIRSLNRKGSGTLCALLKDIRGVRRMMEVIFLPRAARDPIKPSDSFHTTAFITQFNG